MSKINSMHVRFYSGLTQTKIVELFKLKCSGLCRAHGENLLTKEIKMRRQLGLYYIFSQVSQAEHIINSLLYEMYYKTPYFKTAFFYEKGEN